MDREQIPPERSNGEEGISGESVLSHGETSGAAGQDDPRAEKYLYEEQQKDVSCAADARPDGSDSVGNENAEKSTNAPDRAEGTGQTTDRNAAEPTDDAYGMDNAKAEKGDSSSPNRPSSEGTVPSDKPTPERRTFAASAPHPSGETKENKRAKNGNRGLKVALAVVATALALSILLCIVLTVVAIGAFIVNREALPNLPYNSPAASGLLNEKQTPKPTEPSSYNVDEWVNRELLNNPNALVVASAKCSPSVVAITVTLSGGEGAGSGVIWSSDGYIVTNNHVVDGASSITVMLENGSKYQATCISTDAQNDLALLRINVKGLLPVSQGNGADLAVGETVIAIGNPLGTLANTVTPGIISALSRDINVEGTEMNLMQISAAINPGNSGGGCFDIDGNLIGIVNAKTAASGIEGLGFAIPIDTVKSVIERMIANDTSTLRKSIGITGCYEINAENYKEFTSSNLVRKIEELNGSPLYGIYLVSDGLVDYVDNENTFAAWDVIRSVNDTEIHGMEDINAILDGAQTGQELTVKVTRLVSVSYGFMQSRYTLEEVTVKIRVVEMYR